MLMLYNSLSREKEPLEKKMVRLYTCGPTVYNYYHIGNLRNAVFNDTLRRVLESSGYSVQHVMNITDVGHLVSDADEGEDKLEKGATREGKTVWEVAEFYTAAFKKDVAALNILPPSVNPGKTGNKKFGDTYARATDFISEQLEMVKMLLEKGYAYQTKQAIYFEVAKFPEYEKLSGQKLEEKEVAVRSEIVADPEKRSPHDFALWFFTVGHFAGHSMKWVSPWGEGFPGWHLECSAIIHATLGDHIDIHTGGVDHIGTHHPNEIAQSVAAFGPPLAHVWLHNEFILVDGEKMSKSKNNSYLLKDILEKGYSAMDLRMTYLLSHYRSQMNFTWGSLEQGKKTKETLFTTFTRLKNTSGKSGYEGEEERKKIETVLQDDLNTPLAITHALEFSRIVNSMLDKNEPVNQTLLLKNFGTLFTLFGLQEDSLQIPTGVMKLAENREKARQNKNFAEADRFRDEIVKAGFIVEDTTSGFQLKKK